MLFSFHVFQNALASTVLCYNGSTHILLIAHSMSRWMGLLLIITFCSLVFLKDLFLDRYYIPFIRLHLETLLGLMVSPSNFYADDSQLYITFKSSSLLDRDSSISRLTACVIDIDSWMLCNKLKLNKDKTDMLILSSSHRPHPSLSSIAVCGEMISCSSQAHNIGVIFNQSFSMIHVTSICKSSFFHLRNIGLICKFITFNNNNNKSFYS